MFTQMECAGRTELHKQEALSAAQYPLRLSGETSCERQSLRGHIYSSVSKPEGNIPSIDEVLQLIEAHNPPSEKSLSEEKAVYRHTSNCLPAEAALAIARSRLTTEQVKFINQINAVDYSKTKQTDLQRQIEDSQYPVNQFQETAATRLCASLSEHDLYAIAPFLTNLDLRDRRFKEWSSARILELISRCRDLKSLSLIHPEITHLPNLPHCEWLNCYWCLNLREIGSLPRCKYFFCVQCSLEHLPSLPLCEELDCSQTKVKVISDLQLCKKLECRRCERLEVIEGIPRCELIDTCDSSILKSMPQELLHCRLFRSRSAKINSLPHLPLVEVVNCTDCYLIEEIKRLESCKVLNCARCSNLKAVDLLPKGQHLIITSCDALTQRPELPEGTHVECSYCPRLNGKPLLGPGGKIRSDLWFVELAFIHKNPSEFLDELAEKMSAYENLPKLKLLKDDGFILTPNTKEAYAILFEIVLERLFGKGEAWFTISLPLLNLTSKQWEAVGKILAVAAQNEIPLNSHLELEVFEELLPLLKCTEKEFIERTANGQSIPVGVVVREELCSKETLTKDSDLDDRTCNLASKAAIYQAQPVSGQAAEQVADEPLFKLAKAMRPFRLDLSRQTSSAQLDLRGISTAQELKRKLEGKEFFKEQPQLVFRLDRKLG